MCLPIWSAQRTTAMRGVALPPSACGVARGRVAAWRRGAGARMHHAAGGAPHVAWQHAMGEPARHESIRVDDSSARGSDSWGKRTGIGSASWKCFGQLKSHRGLGGVCTWQSGKADGGLYIADAPSAPSATDEPQQMQTQEGVRGGGPGASEVLLGSHLRPGSCPAGAV
eukprot:2607651-Prymnesium_polylepis.1